VNRNRADTDYDTVRAINLENVRRFEVDAAQRIAESYAMLLEAAHWAFLHFYHADTANASFHTAPVRFSPITFRLAEALEAYMGDTGEIEEVLSHRGSYAEDPGR